MRFPILVGYLGTLLFILFALIALFSKSDKGTVVLSVLLFAYGAVILSFLGGIHWGQAVPSGNMRQLSFSMLPTIGCAFLGFMALQLAMPLLVPLGLGVLFYAVYLADRKFMPEGYTPEKYFDFRRKLTIIVCVSLLITLLSLLG